MPFTNEEAVAQGCEATCSGSHSNQPGIEPGSNCAILPPSGASETRYGALQRPHVLGPYLALKCLTRDRQHSFSPDVRRGSKSKNTLQARWKPRSYNPPLLEAQTGRNSHLKINCSSSPASTWRQCSQNCHGMFLKSLIDPVTTQSNSTYLRQKSNSSPLISGRHSTVPVC